MQDDTTWFWQIVDARGLADVSSDEFVALNELISKAGQVDACAEYLKDGETRRERMDRDHADVLGLMKLLAQSREALTTAESERDELLREKERLEAALVYGVNCLCSVRKNYEEPELGLWEDVTRAISEGNAALAPLGEE